MERQKITASQVVVSWGYDPDAKILEVEYRWGSIIQYQDVPPDFARQLEEAESKGSFLAQFIQRKFKFRTIKPFQNPLSPETFTEPIAKPKPKSRKVVVRKRRVNTI